MTEPPPQGIIYVLEKRPTIELVGIAVFLAGAIICVATLRGLV